MIKLFVFNNVCRKEVGQVSLQELISEKDIHTALMQKFQELGCVVEHGRGCLCMKQEKELIPFDDKRLLSDDVTVAYLDVVKPDNAREFERKNGIVYYFGSDERKHFYEPHIHARNGGPKDAGVEKIRINLENFSVTGRFKNLKKQKEAVGYVKANITAIKKMWNDIIVPQGGPRWDD